MKREALEHPIAMEKVGGRRVRGRQRDKLMDSLAAWMNIRLVKITSVFSANGDQGVWNSMVANAVRQVI